MDDIYLVDVEDRAVVKIIVDGKEWFSGPRVVNYLRTQGYSQQEAMDYLDAIRVEK
jgi:hypothetical protein